MKLKDTTIQGPTWEGKAHLTVREAAAYLAVGTTTFREWARLYNLRRVGRDGVVRYPAAEVVRLRDRLTRREK